MFCYTPTLNGVDGRYLLSKRENSLLLLSCTTFPTTFVCDSRSWLKKAEYATCTSPIKHLICPAKFCITFVFYFSWVLQPSQEKLITMLMQNVWGQKRRTMGDVQVAYMGFQLLIPAKFRLLSLNQPENTAFFPHSSLLAARSEEQRLYS